MKSAKVIAVLGLLAMTAVLVYGFTAGDFGVDGGTLLRNPWGIVSMVDLYTGFILFSGWIVYREESRLSAVVWVVLMMVLGFFTGSLYVLIALVRSGGDWKKFWLGKHARSEKHGRRKKHADSEKQTGAE
ncbi:MAG: DUF1475 family protein [Anaerolineales bacterium]|nr:DUF1475 family protein [Anaerolineales bacterium]